jgi:diguanylate cyclase (GGDEF)-like protein/PAS domain S-box-containing protein
MGSTGVFIAFSTNIWSMVQSIRKAGWWPNAAAALMGLAVAWDVISQWGGALADQGFRVSDALLLAGLGTSNHLGFWLMLIGGMAAVIAAYILSANSNRALDSVNRRLKEQNVLFDAALNNMLQGLSMFDARERLLVFNSRFIEMYGLSREVIRPGCSLIELVRHTVEVGGSNHDAEQIRREIATARGEGRSASCAIETADRREFSLISTPMADGGFVITHEDVTERQRSEAMIAYMAHHDALTDLPNRVRFQERLSEALARVHRGENLAVLCLDLDRFKSVNDTLGHPIGDLLLKAVTDRLRQCVRTTDMIARLGGDEFAIVQTDVQQTADATMLATRMIEAVSAPYVIDGHQVVIGLSVGIAIAPSDGLDADLLLKNADMALYRAKADGRGVYRFFEAEMDARMQVRRTLELDLRRAIVNGEFELFYQPLFNTETREITAFEALIRWHHPVRGMIPPLDFVPLAEETGLIVPVGEWVMHKACEQAARWPSQAKVAVNLSPAQFRGKALLSTVSSALARSGLPAERLELEITETVLLQESDATLSTLHDLRALGVRISMDDFGTGYSSLSYLRKFPFDKIKIDGSFIRDITEQGLPIVRAVAAMGSGLGIVTTAEGVETPEQLELLQREGCTEVQGYLLSQPLPVGDVVNLLRTMNPRQKKIA